MWYLSGNCGIYQEIGWSCSLIVLLLQSNYWARNIAVQKPTSTFPTVVKTPAVPFPMTTQYDNNYIRQTWTISKTATRSVVIGIWDKRDARV